MKSANPVSAVLDLITSGCRETGDCPEVAPRAAQPVKPSGSMAEPSNDNGDPCSCENYYNVVMNCDHHWGHDSDGMDGKSSACITIKMRKGPNGGCRLYADKLLEKCGEPPKEITDILDEAHASD